MQRTEKKNYGMIRVIQKKQRQYFDSADWSKQSSSNPNSQSQNIINDNKSNSNQSPQHYSISILKEARNKTKQKSSLNLQIIDE